MNPGRLHLTAQTISLVPLDTKSRPVQPGHFDFAVSTPLAGLIPSGGSGSQRQGVNSAIRPCGDDRFTANKAAYTQAVVSSNGHELSASMELTQFMQVIESETKHSEDLRWSR